MRPANRTNSLYFDAPQYAFQPPPEMDGRGSMHAVVIVGAGPVGLTAALELARHGTASVVIDTKDSISEGSRAICIARHSIECLQQLGIEQRFVDKALPWMHGTSYYRDQPVYRLAMPHGEHERFHPMYNLQQQYIEQFLIDSAQAQPLIDLRWCSRLVDLAQHDAHVSLQVATPAGSYTLESQYVLAADGARSAVREALGLRLAGEAYEGRYIIADVKMRSAYPTERRAFFDPTSNPGLTILVHKQPDDIWRIDYQLDAHDDETDAVREDRIRERVGSIIDMLGEQLSWELEWWSLYKAYTLALDDYRCGRTLFIGDAAHLVPIFGVRGLNSGFADAMNAGWKLAAVLNDDAPEALLDSYSPERRGATLEVFRNAARSTRFMTPPTRGSARMREAVLGLSIHHEFTRALIDPRQSEPYTYVDSTLTSYRHRDAEFKAGPRAGASLKNCRVGDDCFLLDHLGRGYTLLYFSEGGKVPDALLQAMTGMTVCSATARLLVVSAQPPERTAATWIEDPAGAITQAHGARHGSVYLIRPDRHVAARWLRFEATELAHAFAGSLARRTGSPGMANDR